MSKLITELDQASLRTDVPAFRPGDSVKVHVKVVEGNRSRIQVFAGVVISRAGDGVREAFTVRKVSFGVGVERTFPRAQPDHRQDRGRPPRRRPPGEAVLPAWSSRQGRQDQGKARRAAERCRRQCDDGRTRLTTRDAHGALLDASRRLPATLRVDAAPEPATGPPRADVRRACWSPSSRNWLLVVIGAVDRRVAAARLRRPDVHHPVGVDGEHAEGQRPGRGGEAQLDSSGARSWCSRTPAAG